MRGPAFGDGRFPPDFPHIGPEKWGKTPIWTRLRPGRVDISWHPATPFDRLVKGF